MQQPLHSPPPPRVAAGQAGAPCKPTDPPTTCPSSQRTQKKEVWAAQAPLRPACWPACPRAAPHGTVQHTCLPAKARATDEGPGGSSAAATTAALRPSRHAQTTPYTHGASPDAGKHLHLAPWRPLGPTRLASRLNTTKHYRQGSTHTMATKSGGGRGSRPPPGHVAVWLLTTHRGGGHGQQQTQSRWPAQGLTPCHLSGTITTGHAVSQKAIPSCGAATKANTRTPYGTTTCVAPKGLAGPLTPAPAAR